MLGLWIRFHGLALAVIYAMQVYAQENIENSEVNVACSAVTSSDDFPWTYKICFAKDIIQTYDNADGKVVNNIGGYSEHESSTHRQIYRGDSDDCWSETENRFIHRFAEVSLDCCPSAHELFRINSVLEAPMCSYYFDACSQQTPCKLTERVNAVSKESEVKILNVEEQVLVHIPKLISKERSQNNLERVRHMFYTAYDSYMTYAYPQGELLPMSCAGTHFDLIKIPLVTLIDAMDTLVIMNNFSEFRRVVDLVNHEYSDFDLDINVSVFETTIRILGGLLSAHLFAIDPLLAIYKPEHYNNSLLRLAQDLGDRLLPAFDTNTGIPYGTVNLHSGVPLGETEIASTAGAGSLFMEFNTLSALTGHSKYRDVARRASHSLNNKRSPIGLAGKHIHVGNGRWSETISGIGSNSDSFFEYQLKGYLMTLDKEDFDIFASNFVAIKRHLQEGDWFGDVDMFSGKMRRNRVESLHAFWPGLEASIGFTTSAAQILNAFMAVWIHLGYLPEEMDQAVWQQGKSVSRSFYPLRPELVESIFYQFRATKDRSWLAAGEAFLRSIEKTKTKCGYASVTDFGEMRLMDMLPSFFLSETCKYLYLLFDEDNFIHNRPYVFTTEAHPIDLSQLSRHTILNEVKVNISMEKPLKQPKVNSAMDSLFDMLLSHMTVPVQKQSAEVLLKMPKKCSKRIWWDPSPSFDVDYVHKLFDDSTASKESSTSLQLKSLRDILRAYHSSFPTEEFANIVRAKTTDVFQGSQAFADEWAHKVAMNHAAQDDSELKRLGYLTVDPFNQIFGSSHVCPLRSQSADSKQTPASSSAEQHAKPVESTPVELSLGGLGNFVVEIASDGFRIRSKMMKNSLEISNLGMLEVFAREYNSSFSELVIGSVDGFTRRCSVSVVDPTSGLSVWTRSCSTANFGTISMDRPLVAEAKVFMDESDESLHCVDRSIYNSPSSGTNIPVSLPVQRQSRRPISDWVARMFGNKAQIVGEQTLQPNKANKIYIISRGKCTFEEKSFAAKKSGAQGVIIANTEDKLFVMAGKREAEGLKAMTISDRESSNNIPTVMLTLSDSIGLSVLLNKRTSIGAQSTLSMNVRTLPSQLDDGIMGSDDFPKIRVSKNMVHAMTRLGWGVAIVSEDSKQWQLYILKNTDLESSLMYQMNLVNRRNVAEGRIVITTMTGAGKSVNKYASILAQNCPSSLVLRKSGLELLIER